MELYLKNIGKLKEANIKLEGITVVAGENNSGKSTVGKAIYATLQSLSYLGEKRGKAMVEAVLAVVSRSFSRVIGDSEGIISGFSEKYKNREKVTSSDILEYLNELYQLKKTENESDYREFVEEVEEICAVSSGELDNKIVSLQFTQSFSQQAKNFFAEEEGRIVFQYGSEKAEFQVLPDTKVRVSGVFKFHKVPFYVDDPNILDNFSLVSENKIYHRNQMVQELLKPVSTNQAVNQLLAEKKLEKVLSLINSVCGGEFFLQNTVSYGLDHIGETLDIKNLSTGLKSFGILKTLLLNGSLSRGSVLILDEPEVHIHPEWQLIYAELIVLLQKEFKLTILLTTHSPYFLRALEVYAGIHELSEKCHYYFSENDGNEAVIYDVTEDVERIYEKLATPLQELEDLRWSHEG